MDFKVKVTRSYSIKGSEKKQLKDTLKANETFTIKSRRSMKTILVKYREDIEVVEVESEYR